MDKPLLYRKRYIPLEVKSLNDDEILFADDEIIVTKWNTFKPKKDFSNGISERRKYLDIYRLIGRC